MNSAHPYENPSAFTNIIEMTSLLLIPAACCFTFGIGVRNTKQGKAIFAAMFILLVIFTGTIAFVVWQLLSNGGTLWFMMPVVFGSLVSVITFYAVNLIEWKRGVPAAPSAYTVEEAK